MSLCALAACPPSPGVQQVSVRGYLLGSHVYKLAWRGAGGKRYVLASRYLTVSSSYRVNIPFYWMESIFMNISKTPMLRIGAII